MFWIRKIKPNSVNLEIISKDRFQVVLLLSIVAVKNVQQNSFINKTSSMKCSLSTSFESSCVRLIHLRELSCNSRITFEVTILCCKDVKSRLILSLRTLSIDKNAWYQLKKFNYKMSCIFCSIKFNRTYHIHSSNDPFEMKSQLWLTCLWI